MNENINKKKLREFGFLLGFVIPILLGWIFPLFAGHPFREWTLWIGLPFLILAILKPSLLFYPYRIWMFIGFVLGWVNSRLILGLVYILVLMPIAIVMKILGYDPLKQNRNDRRKITYREIRKNNNIDLTRIF